MHPHPVVGVSAVASCTAESGRCYGLQHQRQPLGSIVHILPVAGSTTVALAPGATSTPGPRGAPDPARYGPPPTAPTPAAPTAATPTAARRVARRWTLRSTPATLVAVRGRPTAAS